MYPLDHARNKTDKLIAQYSASLMSDAKWVKLLDALSSIENLQCQATVKLVWDDTPRDFRLDDDLQYQFDYYDKSMEAMISGYPKGWYDYKEIESLTITSTHEQLNIIIKAIHSIGRLETSYTPTEIKILAYR